MKKALTSFRGWFFAFARTLANQIGLQLETDLETKQGVVYLTDPMTVEYARAVANTMIRFGRREQPV